MTRTAGSVRLGAVASITAWLSIGPAGAQSVYDRQDLSNVRVDGVQFKRIDSRPNRIVGTDVNGVTVAIPFASGVTVFGLSNRLKDIRPGDDVSIRSTTNDIGAVVATDIDVNLHAFDALVTSSVDRRGFEYQRLDYHTGVPLRGRKYVGRAIVLAKAAIDVEHGRVMWSGSVDDITIGDKIKLYGFERADSRLMYVFRVEDRGH